MPHARELTPGAEARISVGPGTPRLKPWLTQKPGASFCVLFRACFYCTGLVGGTSSAKSPMVAGVLWFWGLTWEFWAVFEGVIFGACKLLEGWGFGAGGGWRELDVAAAGGTCRSLRDDKQEGKSNDRSRFPPGMTERKARAKTKAGSSPCSEWRGGKVGLGCGLGAEPEL
jgi:hypothetical protein